MNNIHFNNNDLGKLKKHRISLDDIDKQISKFIKGSPFSDLVKPATTLSGISKLNSFNKEELLSLYDIVVESDRISKFVPASGAATRMFKDLLEFYYSDYKNINDKCEEVFSEINNFPFYDDLKKTLFDDGHNINELLKDKNYQLILKYLLFEKGLNYSNLPKGLLKFSKYEDNSITALEEHFFEGIDYASDQNNKIKIHFTVSEEHLNDFEKLVKELQNKFLSDYTFDVTFSTQKPSTDTLAVDENNEPFRDNNNEIVLRPGGHGALIHNLNSLNADILFIKNIDNVQSGNNNLSLYKKLLAGILLKNQSKIFKHVDMLQKKNSADLTEIESFIINDLNISLHVDYTNKTTEEKIDHLLSLLIRPIRVCGMVQNTGAPGGGPFFVRKNDDISLQIVESSQIDLTKEDQKKIFESSTHFNPVDIVCALKDKDGDSFNLLNYIDQDTYFISNKSVDGKPLKALELPGLWNGAMAEWITIFVEVPLETFTPVKTVNDLLHNS
ncbi:MAG: DUF4301 family protein [Candidatus Delongbacteria bacterium]|jgi:hypothetical protein|nr:DUF4301 family protein [Candidatus Delongbacteria bacterium]